MVESASKLLTQNNGGEIQIVDVEIDDVEICNICIPCIVDKNNACKHALNKQFDTGPTTVRKFHMSLKEICDLENFKRAISYKARNLLSRLCSVCIHDL